jgi:hypothetical protein
VLVAFFQEVVGFPTIGQDQGARLEVFLEPRLEFLGRNRLQRFHLQEQHLVGVLHVGLDGHHKGRLPLGSPPTLALVPFPAIVGIVYLHPTGQPAVFLPLRHHQEKLLLHTPGRFVVNAKLPF